METLLRIFVQFFATHFAIAKDFRKQTGTNDFASVQGHNSSSTISVSKKVVTALYTHHLKPSLFQRGNDVLAGNAG